MCAWGFNFKWNLMRDILLGNLSGVILLVSSSKIQVPSSKFQDKTLTLFEISVLSVVSVFRSFGFQPFYLDLGTWILFNPTNTPPPAPPSYHHADSLKSVL